jgi:hypothetical protein
LQPLGRPTINALKCSWRSSAARSRRRPGVSGWKPRARGGSTHFHHHEVDLETSLCGVSFIARYWSSSDLVAVTHLMTGSKTRMESAFTLRYQPNVRFRFLIVVVPLAQT